MSGRPDKPFLQIVACAAGVATDVGKLITAAHERNWDVGVVATPQGLGFLDVEAVEAQTGLLTSAQPGGLRTNLARPGPLMRSR